MNLFQKNNELFETDHSLISLKYSSVFDKNKTYLVQLINFIYSRKFHHFDTNSVIFNSNIFYKKK